MLKVIQGYWMEARGNAIWAAIVLWGAPVTSIIFSLGRLVAKAPWWQELAIFGLFIFFGYAAIVVLVHFLQKRSKRFQEIARALVLVVMILSALLPWIGIYSQAAAPTTTGPVAKIQGNNNQIQQAGRDFYNTTTPDYLPGTVFTEKMLREVFPFGYVVARLGDATWAYLPDQVMLKQEIDWQKLRIRIDFEKREAIWDFPELNLRWRDLEVTGNKALGGHMSIRPGLATVCPLFIAPPDQPLMLLGTLSDDQLHPAFVVGFRIMGDLSEGRTISLTNGQRITHR